MTGIKRIAAWFVGILITVSTAFAGMVPASAIRTYAAKSQYLFDGTNITEDLTGFDLSEYEQSTEPELITVIEFCFAENILDCGNYALYAYVYNPEQMSYSERNGANVLNMAVEYGEDGEPSGYKNMPLIFCGATQDGLIYKYRIEDEGEQLLNNVRLQNAAHGERRYDVAGVQLWEQGKSLPKDYKVGQTFYYEGYAKGMGKESALQSTLTLSNAKTTQLEVHHTFYRPPDEIFGDNGMTQDQMNSVYFAIDNELLERYGRLKKVHAEWYEYKTKPIVITESEELYDALKLWLGVDVGEKNSNLNYSLATELSTVTSTIGGQITLYHSDWGYNVGNNPSVDERETALYYLFDTYNEATGKYEALGDFILRGEDLEEYLNNYDRSYTNGTLDIAGKNVSADLFTDEIDQARVEQGYKIGKNEVNIEESVIYTILSHEDTTPWWKLWFMDSSYSTSTFANAKAIEAVDEADIKLSKEEFCSTFLVDENDYEEFVSFWNQSNAAGKTVYLFRFAQTEYYSRSLEVGHYQTSVGLIPTTEYVYNYSTHPTGYAQSTVFLNYDVIDLTLDKNGKETVIGVVANPIDIYPDIKVPSMDLGAEWWVIAIILAVVLLVIMIITVIVEKEMKK